MDDSVATYGEARDWIVYLGTFTPGELADCMLVDHAVAERYVYAAMFWGIVEPTGDSVNGTEAGYEPLYRWKPLPPGPRYARTFPPEWKITPGCGSLAPRRGLPVRLLNGRDQRRIRSTTGGGAMREKLREKRYQQMMQAREAAKKRKAERKEEKKKTSSARKAEAIKAHRRAKREEKKEGILW